MVPLPLLKWKTLRIKVKVSAFFPSEIGHNFDAVFPQGCKGWILVSRCILFSSVCSTQAVLAPMHGRSTPCPASVPSLAAGLSWHLCCRIVWITLFVAWLWFPLLAQGAVGQLPSQLICDPFLGKEHGLFLTPWAVTQTKLLCCKWKYFFYFKALRIRKVLVLWVEKKLTLILSWKGNTLIKRRNLSCLWITRLLGIRTTATALTLGLITLFFKV